MKLFQRQHMILMSAAVLAGLGLGGYQIAQERGGLDAVGIIAVVVTAFLIGGVFALVIRHGNKPE